MSAEAPTKEHLWEVLMFLIKWKKGAVEAHNMIAEIYGHDVITAWLPRNGSIDLKEETLT